MPACPQVPLLDLIYISCISKGAITRGASPAPSTLQESLNNRSSWTLTAICLSLFYGPQMPKRIGEIITATYVDLFIPGGIDFKITS